MSGLQSMLVPLETLPGWPAAPDPSPLHLLLLLIAIPVVLAVVVGGASYMATTSEVKRFGPPVNPTTTFSGAPGVEGASGEVRDGIDAGPDHRGGGTGAEGGSEHRGGATSTEAGTGRRGVSTGAETGTGGTSARW